MEDIFLQKANYYDECIQVLSNFHKNAKQTKLPLVEWTSRFSLFIVLGAYDLWILMYNVHTSVTKYQQNFYARQISLLVFELMQDIPQNLSKEFHTIYFTILGNSNFNLEAVNIKKSFDLFQNKHASYFKKIRDLVAAHREHNADIQLNIINDMNDGEVSTIAFEFIQNLEKLMVLMNNTIRLINKDSRIFIYKGNN